MRLFEWRGCLGGIWTAGLLGYFLDFNKPGFAKELRELLDARDARANSRSISRFCYDPEALKLLLEELCVEAGVKFQFHTKVCAAFKEGNRLTTIVTESKSGRQAWTAPVFIDTTGDGDLGFQAGCAFETGMAQDCPCQPMSLNALLVVKDTEALREFIRFGTPIEGDNSDGEKKKRIREALASTGHFPSYANPTMWHVRNNLIFAMMNHAIMPNKLKMQPYDIPRRALIAKDVDGLMMAGRCISGDFIAHSGYRVTGNAVAMGEAAGVTAALAALSGRLTHEVSWNESRSKLSAIEGGRPNSFGHKTCYRLHLNFLCFFAKSTGFGTIFAHDRWQLYSLPSCHLLCDKPCPADHPNEKLCPRDASLLRCRTPISSTPPNPSIATMPQRPKASRKSKARTFRGSSIST